MFFSTSFFTYFFSVSSTDSFTCFSSSTSTLFFMRFSLCTTSVVPFVPPTLLPRPFTFNLLPPPIFTKVINTFSKTRSSHSFAYHWLCITFPHPRAVHLPHPAWGRIQKTSPPHSPPPPLMWMSFSKGRVLILVP